MCIITLYSLRQCGRRLTTALRLRTPSVTSISETTGAVEPLYFAQVSNFRVGSGSGTNKMTQNSRLNSSLGIRSVSTGLASQLSEFLVVLTQEQIVRALELSLLCEEYGKLEKAERDIKKVNTRCEWRQETKTTSIVK